MPVTKRHVQVDDDLLAKASAVLGTTRASDTVNRALEETVQAALRRRHAVRLASGAGTDLSQDSVMADAWGRTSQQ